MESAASESKRLRDSPIKRDVTDDDGPSSPPGPPAATHTATRIGNYVLEKTLGEGAFAKVKAARHVVTGQRVAIKIIYKHKIKDDYVRENLQREGQLLRRLHHPHVIQLYEIIETDRVYCLVTECADGGELLDHIVAHHTLSEREVRKYIRQLTSAVDHLHKNKIVHRDLKAENLILDANLDLKIIDFGLSNSIDRADMLATQCGSPAYTAPECLGGKKYGPEVDIWSIGINMFAMLTGRLPFSSQSVTALHAMILEQKCKIPAELSADCKDLLARLLTVKVSERITLAEIMAHPWINVDLEPLAPAPVQRRLSEADLDAAVVQQMVRLGMNQEQVQRSVVQNVMNDLHATYTLLKMRSDRDRSGREEKPLRRNMSERMNLMSSGEEPSEVVARGATGDAIAEVDEELPATKRSTSLHSKNSLNRMMKRSAIGSQLPNTPSSATAPTSGVAPPSETVLSRPPSAKPGSSAVFRRHSVAAGMSVDLSRLPSSSSSSSTSSTAAAAAATGASDDGLSPTGPLAIRRRSDGRRPTLDLARSPTDRPAPLLPKISPNGRQPPPADLASASKLLEPVEMMSVPRGSRTNPVSPALSPTPSTDVVRTLRFPLSQRMVSQKSPDTIVQDLQLVLGKHQIMFSCGETKYCLNCLAGAVVFEAEIVKVPRLPLHGIHFKRLKGETDIYQQICTRIIDDMSL